jgi:hypothetical protein
MPFLFLLSVPTNPAGIRFYYPASYITFIIAEPSADHSSARRGDSLAVSKHRRYIKVVLDSTYPVGVVPVGRLPPGKFPKTQTPLLFAVELVNGSPVIRRS